MNHTIESVAGELGIPPEELLRAAVETGISEESVTDGLLDNERTQLLEARTIKAFGEKLGVSPAQLLTELDEIGIPPKDSIETYLSPSELNQRLGARTVKAFAEKLDISPAQLLTELDEIGMPKKSVDAYVSVDEQWQRENARPVEILARRQGIAADSLLRKLEEIGRPKPSVGSLVTKEEWEQISRFVLSHHIASTIRGIREYRGLTRAMIAEQVAVSERQLAKIEAGEVALVDARQAERIGKLAAALGLKVELGERKGLKTAASLGPEPQQDPVAISALVTPQARSGFTRIRERYGWSIAQVMELAPLMFVLLAEGSLARRRRRLQELHSVRDEVPLELDHFLRDFRGHLEKEESSIQDRKLRHDNFSGGLSPDPLSAYLFELAGTLGDAGAPIPPAGEPRRGERLLLDWLLRDDIRCQACHEPIKPEHVYCISCGAPTGRNPSEG